MRQSAQQSTLSLNHHHGNRIVMMPDRTVAVSLTEHDGWRILDAIPCPVAIVQETGRIAYRNQAWRGYLGEAAEFAEAVGGQSAASIAGREVIRGVLESGSEIHKTCWIGGPSKGRPSEVRMSRWGAEKRSLLVTIQPVRGATDPGLVDELTERLRSLDSLASKIAHELGNPLDGILRYVNLALRLVGDAEPPKLRDYLSESRTGLVRMAEILADLARTARRNEHSLIDQDVNAVVDQALHSLAPAMERQRIIVASDYRLPRVVAANSSRLYQVFCNLAKNAVEAMPEGGRLMVTTARVDGCIVVEFADTGSGLPPETSRLFEPFYTTKPEGKGVGLGLAICKELIAGFGGEILASPGEPSGAVFTVRIPEKNLQAGGPSRTAACAEEYLTP